MPPRSPEPLRRTTLNLFEEDCRLMERRYGHGWSERVRDLVRNHVSAVAKPSLDELLEIMQEDEDAQ